MLAPLLLGLLAQPQGERDLARAAWRAGCPVTAAALSARTLAKGSAGPSFVDAAASATVLAPLLEDSFWLPAALAKSYSQPLARLSAEQLDTLNYLVGVASLRRGHYDEALTFFAVGVDPRRIRGATLLAALAVLHEPRAGGRRQALAKLESLPVELSSKDQEDRRFAQELLWVQALLHQALGEREAALARLSRIPAAAPLGFESLVGAGRLELELGHPERARQIADALLGPAFAPRCRGRAHHLGVSAARALGDAEEGEARARRRDEEERPLLQLITAATSTRVAVESLPEALLAELELDRRYQEARALHQRAVEERDRLPAALGLEPVRAEAERMLAARLDEEAHAVLEQCRRDLVDDLPEGERALRLLRLTPSGTSTAIPAIIVRPVLPRPRWAGEDAAMLDERTMTLYARASVRVRNEELARSTAANRARAELSRVLAVAEGQSPKMFAISVNGIEIIADWWDPSEGATHALARLELGEYRQRWPQILAQKLKRVTPEEILGP